MAMNGTKWRLEVGWGETSSRTPPASNDASTKLSQFTVSKGGDVREEAPAEKWAAKTQQTTVRHLGFTEKCTRFSAHASYYCQYRKTRVYWSGSQLSKII